MTSSLSLPEIADTELFQECIFAGGECQGHIRPLTFIWHVRPRPKDIVKGKNEPHVTTLDIEFCCYHNALLTTKYSVSGLPKLYGWDFWDAVDGLVLE